MIVYSASQGKINASTDLEIAQYWSPQYSEVLLNVNERFLTDGVTAQEGLAIEGRSIQALRKAPLSFKPFLHRGEVRVLQNDNDNVAVRGLFTEVKTRNTRNRRALRALVNLDIKDQKFGEAVHNLDVLLRLKGETDDVTVYQQTLTALSQFPEGNQKIASLLPSKPAWGQRYLFNQIASMSENNFSDIGKSLQLYTGAADLKGTDRKLHASYLLKLTRMNKPEDVHNYWTALFGNETVDSEVSLYNPKFEKRAALPPYNWSEIDRPKYFSEIDEGGGIYASFTDNKVRTLTEQLLRLTPGAVYRLNVDAEWSYRRRQGMFFWVITCNQTNDVISGVNLDDEAKEMSGGEHTFMVPAEGCAYQHIRLVAKSGQYSKRIWSRTNSVTLEKVQ